MKIPALFFLCALLVTFPLSNPVSAESNPPGTDWKEWSLDTPHPEMGCEFPDFSLPDTGGNTVRFGDFRGKVTLLSFCSCYTDTCCPVIDALEKIRERYGSRVFSVLVCCETAPALAMDQYAGIRSQCSEAADLVLIDKDFQTKVPFLVGSLPTLYLIDATFCMRYKARSVADLNAPEFREALEAALQGTSAP